MPTPKKNPKKQGGKKKVQSRSSRAGLTFPVGRIARMLRDGKYAQRVGKAAPVFIASVLEYLIAELVELAGSTAREAKKKRITPRFLNLAIRNDEELSQLLHSATIAGGGVKPHILKQLKQKKKGGHKSRHAKKHDKGEKKHRSKKSDKSEHKKKKKKEKRGGATQEA